MSDRGLGVITTPVSARSLRAAADALIRAQATLTPCGPVRELLPGADVSTAYAVQGLVNQARDAGGAHRVGRKVGLTGVAIQTQLGVAEPDFGVLFSDMDCPAGEIVDIEDLLQPRIEAEVAVVLAEDLDAPVAELTSARVRAAVQVVMPAFEIVASRVADWDITIVDTVADNASAGRYVLGEPRRPESVDLRAIRMRMTDASGAEVATGSGTDAMGDPMISLAWLARTVAALGAPLRAGEVILTGALGPMVPVTPGDAFRATLGGLGSVAVQFSGARR